MLERQVDRPGTDGERFERAAGRYVRACVRELAHEAVHQGWITAFLAEEFGWGRVLREVHVQARDLLECSSAWELARQFAWREGQSKGALNPDVCIADSAGLDCRKSQSRTGEMAGVGILGRLSIVAELKVVGAVADARAQRRYVLRDLAKLGLYMAAAAAIRSDARPPDAYLFVLDNARSIDSRVAELYERDAVEEELGRVRGAWLPGLAAPVVLVGRPVGEGIMDIYRGFAFEETTALSAFV